MRERLILYCIVSLLVVGSVAGYVPDADGDGCIDFGELIDYISVWNQGQVSLLDVVDAIVWWKQGCGQYSPLARGWIVGCKGYGAAVVEAICVKKSDLSYSIAALGSQLHYIDDEISYFAESYCGDDEVAIGGQGGCNEGGGTGHEVRPSMVFSNWIQ